jgi:TonB family protein
MFRLRVERVRIASSLIVLSLFSMAQDSAFNEAMKKHFFPPPPGVTRVIISQGVLKPKKQVQPVNPGHEARLAGNVKLAVLIGEDGKVQQIHMIEGNPMLVTAAIEAVKQWEYSPMKVENKPVQVATEVLVKFNR